MSVASSGVALWTHQVLFDSDRFVATVDNVLDDPHLYVLIANEAAESVFEALAIQDRLADRLDAFDTFISDGLLDVLEVDEATRMRLESLNRLSFGDLAPPISEALQDRIGEGFQTFFNSLEFRSRSPELMRRAHEAIVALVRGDSAELANVYIENGEVRLSLVTYIGEALRRVDMEIRTVIPGFELPDVISSRVEEARSQLEDALGERLPDDFGVITIVSESKLSETQAVARQLDRFVWATMLLSLTLLVATLIVSTNRRRTVIHLGLGVFVAVVGSILAVEQLESAIVQEISDPDGAQLAGDIIRNVLSGLRGLELFIAFTAILIAAIAYLAGRPLWFMRWTSAIAHWTDATGGFSRLDRWIDERAGFLRANGVLAAAAALLLVGPDLLSMGIIGLSLLAFLVAVSTAERRVGRVQVDSIGRKRSE